MLDNSNSSSNIPIPTQTPTSRLIRAFLRQPVDRTPVWFMRQAGRYLPEYLAIREKIPDFMTLCKTPELACEVTLQPVERFDLDAVIFFSDILTIPDAMGLGLKFIQHEGPCFAKTIRSLSDINQLKTPDPETELKYVIDTLRLVKSSLKKPLPVIGFSGSPWTLAAYMIEGKGSSNNFETAKKMLYQNPEILNKLLHKLSDSIIQYLNAQISAGADAVMIFDTWGGLLSTSDYKNFSLLYIQKIISQLNIPKNNLNPIPIIVFTKFGGQWLESISQSGCHVIGLDWTTSLSKARLQVGNKVALQGNLDPVILLTTPTCIDNTVSQLLEDYGPYPGHIFNLGHGILPDTPIDNVYACIESVIKHSKKYHAA